jgi:C-terminal processing protease CtpA/Prc
VAYFGWGRASKGHPSLKIIGQCTAGASSEKSSATVPSGLFSFHYTIRGRKGINNCGPGGLIEYYGVKPDVEVIPDVEDLRRGEDTHIKCALGLLDDKTRIKGR